MHSDFDDEDELELIARGLGDRMVDIRKTLRTAYEHEVRSGQHPGVDSKPGHLGGRG